MKLKNILIVVDNIEESIHFYNELFGLNVISRQEGNVIMSDIIYPQQWTHELV